MKNLLIILTILIVAAGCGGNSQKDVIISEVVEEPKQKSENLIVPKVFREKCSACHSVTATCTIGTDLKTSFERFPYKGWFRQYMFKQDSLINAEEPYVLSLKEEYQIKHNHNLSDLSEEEFNELESLLKNLK